MYVDQEFDYYYGEQIRNYIAQFAQVFSEMYVRVGKNDYKSENNFVRIPIVYGSPDKVVSALKSENTQNKMVRLPMFSIKFDAIGIQMDRMSGTNTQIRTPFLPFGGDIKEDIKVIYRMKPIPYNITFSVAAYTSNTDQMLQVMEQILMLFDPMLQFQTSDSQFDWTKIVDAELTGVDLTDNRSPENDGRIIVSTYTFDVRAYLAPPANIKKNAIQSIKMRIESIASSLNPRDYVADVGRPEPKYETIFDLDSQDIPPN